MDLITYKKAVKDAVNTVTGTDFAAVMKAVEDAVKTAKILEVSEKTDGHVSLEYKE